MSKLRCYYCRKNNVKERDDKCEECEKQFKDVIANITKQMTNRKYGEQI